MLANITFEKIEEIVRLAERATADPGGRADDPQRGSGGEGVTLPGTPPEPQPESDWRHALRRYLSDLPEPALAEVAGLYRSGGGRFTEGGAKEGEARPAEFLASRSDLSDCLKKALARL